MSATENKAEERYDASWRQAAVCDLEAAAYQIQRTLVALKEENDYFAQVSGHSALGKIAEALSNIAAVIERKPGSIQKR